MRASTPLPDRVSQRLAGFIATRRAAAVEDSADAAVLIEAAAAATDGGKRLRARFCHTGWRAVAPAAETNAHTAGADAILDVAAALELFQAAALVHDDLIDNSDTRRGRPSSHRLLEALHTERGWTGSAEAFGRSAAILLGDLLVAWSDDLTEDALASLPHAGGVRHEYARMRRDVTLGQFLDIAQESAWVTQPDALHADRALEIASLKSARYSVQQPLVIGAAVGAGSPEQLASLRAFGLPVGLAFQLRDDVLGVFGDAAVTGKPSGDDLREGKRTLLVAYAREGCSPEERAWFDRTLGAADLDDADIARLQTCIRESGAPERVEERITAYAAEAEAVLQRAPLATDAVAELRDLARAAIERTT